MDREIIFRYIFVCVTTEVDHYFQLICFIHYCIGQSLCIHECTLVRYQQRTFFVSCFDAIWCEWTSASGCRDVSSLSYLCAGFDIGVSFVEREKNRKQQVYFTTFNSIVRCHNRMYSGMLCKSGGCCKNIKKILNNILYSENGNEHYLVEIVEKCLKTQ